MRLRLLVSSLVAVIIVVGFGVWYFRAPTAVEAPNATAVAMAERDTAGLAPDSTRVRVRVLNGTDKNGLARRGTQRLRDYGYDVVDYNTAADPTAQTVVEVDRNSRAYAARIVKALGGGVVRERDEPSPYYDVTVTLGSDWKPSSQSFRP
jgi:hypothetical protein